MYLNNNPKFKSLCIDNIALEIKLLKMNQSKLKMIHEWINPTPCMILNSELITWYYLWTQSISLKRTSSKFWFTVQFIYSVYKWRNELSFGWTVPLTSRSLRHLRTNIILSGSVGLLHFGWMHFPTGRMWFVVKVVHSGWRLFCPLHLNLKKTP